MRSVVSYDDLEQLVTTSALAPPPAKKRKRQQNRRKSAGSQKFVHWDEPLENPDVSFTGQDYVGDIGDKTAELDSRELSHDEIWDDSALIGAWDAAMDEYKAFHGPEGKWKTEHISKPSALWYNVPPSICEKQEGYTMPSLEHDSVPLNFDTFVPPHNPALPNLAPTDTQNLTDISQDEAFKNALNAMYWTGYWTAVYHCRSPPDQPMSEEMNSADSDKYELEAPDVNADMDRFVTSQR